jgi:hypothetical protein
LFLSCQYCNGRKPNEFDILDPINDNIEDIISHRISWTTKSATFTSAEVGLQEDYTVRLLDRLFNGKDGIRDIKGEILYKDMEREILFFMELLNTYKNEPTAGNKKRVVDSLLITKEFLAFKYHVIKDHVIFYDEFKDFMVWNKVA